MLPQCGIVTTLWFKTEAYNPHLSEKLPKEKHITYLNAFVHLMKFSCVIFHLFYHVVQFLSHATHWSGHNIYLFGNIMDCLVQYTNCLTLLVNYTNNTTTINIPFPEPWQNVEMSTASQFVLLKPAMTSYCHLRMVSIEICVSARTEIIFGWKWWWVGSLYLTDGSFPIIPRNASWNIRTLASRIRLNFVLCISCVLWKKSNQQTNSPN